MKIVIYNKHMGNEYAPEVKRVFPHADIRQWSDISGTDWKADYAFVWQPPRGFFVHQNRLKAVFNQGVGVEGLVDHPELPIDLPVIKLRNVGMERCMLEYVMYGLLHFYRGFDVYRYQQLEHDWQQHRIESKSDWVVGVLGLGVIGGAVASHIVKQGFPVCGWSLTEKHIDGVISFTGKEGLDNVLSQSSVVVSLLPETEKTKGLLNQKTLCRLPKGAVLISCGRGSTVDLKAVQAFLDAGYLRGAVFDAFAHEPLDQKSSLWDYPNVIMTPHISAMTLLDKAANELLHQITRLEAGGDLMPVD